MSSHKFGLAYFLRLTIVVSCMYISEDWRAINPVFRNIQTLTILQYKHLTVHFRDQCKNYCYKSGAQLNRKKSLDILVNPRRTYLLVRCSYTRTCSVMTDAEILTV